MYDSACLDTVESRGQWHRFDDKFDSSNTEKCEQLCKDFGQDGCCQLENTGCYWLPNSESAPLAMNQSNTGHASSTSCSLSKCTN